MPTEVVLIGNQKGAILAGKLTFHGVDQAKVISIYELHLKFLWPSKLNMLFILLICWSWNSFCVKLILFTVVSVNAFNFNNFKILTLTVKTASISTTLRCLLIASMIFVRLWDNKDEELLPKEVTFMQSHSPVWRLRGISSPTYANIHPCGLFCQHWCSSYYNLLDPPFSLFAHSSLSLSLSL